jgi:hypothetical protein
MILSLTVSDLNGELQIVNQNKLMLTTGKILVQAFETFVEIELVPKSLFLLFYGPPKVPRNGKAFKIGP